MGETFLFEMHPLKSEHSPWMIWSRATREELSKVPLNAQWAQKSFDWDVLVCVFMDVYLFGLGLVIVFYSIQSSWECGAGEGGLTFCGSGAPCVSGHPVRFPVGFAGCCGSAVGQFLHYWKFSVMTWAKGSERVGLLNTSAHVIDLGPRPQKSWHSHSEGPAGKPGHNIPFLSWLRLQMGEHAGSGITHIHATY